MTGFLRNAYAVRNGRITAWGTFNILFNGIEEPAEDVENIPGLAMWSEKLVPHAKAGRRVVIGPATVDVISSDGTIAEAVPHSEFVPVTTVPSYVHENGYLEASIIRKNDDAFFVVFLMALSQAAEEQYPCIRDNSPFTKVDTALAGQEVIVIEIRVDSRNPKLVVFSMNGELIPSVTHHPLSYAKWESESNLARYSTVD